MALMDELYRFALEHAADAVLITDTKTVTRYVNPAFERLTGYAAGEILGKKPGIQASARTTLEDYQALWETVLDQGWWRGELVNRRKSGEEWHAMLSISQVRDGGGRLVAYVSIATDVTEERRLQARLREAGLEAIYMLSVACEAKDDATGNHIARIQHYAYAVARQMGLPEDVAEEIGYSSIMHDVGKIHVPDGILQKPGPLSVEEWRLMRRHPVDGVSILRDKPFYQVARDIAENHHERWDGTGYPKGRKGEEIPLAARIVSVADVYDALATRRPYKEPWSEEAALKELVRLGGSAFDPRVVDAFLSVHKTGKAGEIRRMFP